MNLFHAFSDFQVDYVKILFFSFVIWFGLFNFLLECFLYFLLDSNYCGISKFVCCIVYIFV
jgi:hypothetical protein